MDRVHATILGDRLNEEVKSEIMEHLSSEYKEDSEFEVFEVNYFEKYIMPYHSHYGESDDYIAVHGRGYLIYDITE